jgi:arginyl-tRNA synthetase
MILPVQEELRAHVARLLTTLYSLDESARPPIVLEYPPNRELGDLGTPVAFELARRLRKAPRVIAQEIADGFGSLGRVRRATAAPNGYLNFFLERRDFLIERLAPGTFAATRTASTKAIVEHTAINPNKAAHIGHLRNAALGDTLVRVLRFRGVPVEVQNYIDDTGVQVADVVVGFRALEGKGVNQVRETADATRFDYYCWDLYARVTEWYEGDKARLAIRAQTLHDIEHGGNENAEIAAFVADRIVRCHLRTMARMNVDYDLLTWEGDILRLKFWAHAFDVLKATGAVYLQTEGRLKGCWVMAIQEDLDANPKAQIPKPTSQEPIGSRIPDPGSQPEDDDEEREKVIVRSNGVVTYVGKDIAYQFWKLGLLGKDFQYRIFETRPQAPLWATCTDGGERNHPLFGGAAYVYNVIDVRQSYLQKLLKQALIAVGHPEGAERSHHFSYEMVALSHATARELGYAPPPESEEAKRPFVEVSGRKGLGVKADDLLDTLIKSAGREVGTRNPEFDEHERDRIARMIGIAAVRYFMIKFSRGKVIAFDLEEALSFEGESGPYIQYAVVRANNIFQKLYQRDGLDEAALLKTLCDVPAGELDGANGSHELWSLVLDASRLDEVVEQVVRSLEFSVLAKYAFTLAQAFNAFYHRAPILNEERDDVRRWRAAAVIYVRNQLRTALDLMGVAVPPRM